MILKLVVLLVLLNFRSSLGQFLSCSYRNNDTYGYTCDLTIQNPNGLNNFVSIGGTHLTGKTNNDVRRVLRVFGSNTTNVPSIICDKFQSVTRINMDYIGIQTIDEKAFENCKKLQILNLSTNRITKVDEKAFTENLELIDLDFFYNQLSELSENLFKNQKKLTRLSLYSNKLSDLPKKIFNSFQNLISLNLGGNELKYPRVEWFLSLGSLQTLYLRINQIEQLPRNIFMPLKNMESIYLENNNIKVINSDPFRGLYNLKTVFLSDNKIEAIDERFIDNTGVDTLIVPRNICVHSNIFDNSTSRISMRLTLQDCFENFDDLIPAKFRILEEKISYLVSDLENLNTRMDTQARNHEELKNLVYELSNRPCACK
ncbi:hypothetical protein ACKWTF_001505 [Chironomus riparius]